jgi:hypothetical protein
MSRKECRFGPGPQAGYGRNHSLIDLKNQTDLIIESIQS